MSTASYIVCYTATCFVPWACAKALLLHVLYAMYCHTFYVMGTAASCTYNMLCTAACIVSWHVGTAA